MGSLSPAFPSYEKRGSVPGEEDGYSSDSTVVQSPHLGDHKDLLEHQDRGRFGMAGDGAEDDLESQKRRLNRPDTSSGQVGAEYSVPSRTKYIFLTIYFGLNLGLTLFNKAVLGKFRFPWLLTAVHTSTAAVGCSLLLSRGQFKMTKLTTRENMILVAFSVLYTINIAISNVSLEMVSVSFHQILRSTSPLFTILIYRLWYSRSYETATYISLLPIVFGAALTTYGDYYFTVTGFILTLFGVILAALKTVATNRLMTGNLKLPALELLFRMSPLAAVQSIVFAYLAGEIGSFRTYVLEGNMNSSATLALMGNGLLAFFLNIASLHTNKLAGALTMSICANLKQCLTVLLGILLFEGNVTLISGAGMVITLGGAALYSKVELQLKSKQSSNKAKTDEAKGEEAKPLNPLGIENRGSVPLR